MYNIMFMFAPFGKSKKELKKKLRKKIRFRCLTEAVSYHLTNITIIL